MTPVMEVQGYLLGAGVCAGVAAAGLGAYRLFLRASRSVLVIPSHLERCASALERSVLAMEEHNSLGNMVLEIRKLLVATRDDINRDTAEHENFRRELRILSRRMEGERIYVQAPE